MKIFGFFYACCFGFLTFIYAAELSKTGCLEKEKALTSLETAEGLLKKARDSFPSCKDDENSTGETDCGKKKSLAYIEISKNLIADARRNFPKCSKPTEKDEKIVMSEKPRDCSEILTNGNNSSGVFTIWQDETDTLRNPLQVYCDMETDHGGWTLIQRRGKFPIQQDFYQDWESYKNGFGNVSEEFWLGNENIRVLCDKGCEIRFDLQDESGLTGFAHYKNFTLSIDKYRISINDYTGTVGDSMKNHNTFVFSTKDKGRIRKAEKFSGGWWYMDNNWFTNLNGLYQPGENNAKAVFWRDWKKNQNLAKVEMKVRQK